MSETVWLNGAELSELGVLVTDLEGWASPVSVQRGGINVPGRIGAVQSRYAISPPRMIRIRGLIDGATAEDRRAIMREVHGHCVGEVQIRFGDSPDQYITGILEGGSAGATLEARHLADNTPSTIALEFLCADPAFYDVEETAIPFGTAPAQVEVGTVPSGGVIRITGGADPVLTYRDGIGNVVQTMGFTVSLGASEYIDVDLFRHTIRHSDGSNGLPYWTSGDWFAPGPTEANYRLGLWPTLAVSSGSAVYTYRKAYSA